VTEIVEPELHEDGSTDANHAGDFATRKEPEIEAAFDTTESYSVTIEVDVAKILGVVALFALAVLCGSYPSGQHGTGESTIHAIWRFLTPDGVARH
jgi:hypothetical protein